MQVVIKLQPVENHGAVSVIASGGKRGFFSARLAMVGLSETKCEHSKKRRAMFANDQTASGSDTLAIRP